MWPALCARCDGVDRRRVAPTVTLDIVRHWQPSGRSGVGLVYDALYAWDEATASTEFLRLRDALGSCTSDRPPTQAALVLAFLKQDCDTTRRDLQTLLARSRDPGREDGGQFQLARVFAHGDAVQVRSPHYAPILTTLVDSGMCSRLPPNAHYDSTLTPEESAYMWQWLIDWAERANASPQVENVSLVKHPGQTAELLGKVLQIVVAENATLRQLTLNWPLHLETNAEQRRRAAEVIGAALFAPRARVRLDKLTLDLGNLSDDDVAALKRGARESGGTRSDASGDDDAWPRFQSVEWNAENSSSANVGQVVRLLGVVGMRELEISGGYYGLPCHTLRTVLESCDTTITTLKWCGLACDDVHELEDATPWANPPRQLRELRVLLPDGNDPNTLRVADALLSRVGSNLTDFTVSSYPSVFTDRMAQIILARCPRLRTLDVKNASPEFFECLVHAYNDGRCGISTLKATMKPGERGTEWAPLLLALSDTTGGGAAIKT